MSDENYPSRKWLRHEVPFPVRDAVPMFFVTICCRERGRNQLATDEMWSFLRETIEKRDRERQWHCSLFLAMPDHVHGIFRFAEDQRMADVIAQWKRWTARQRGIVWQKGFFDHRLRNTLSATEKRSYILMNPVRAGLVGEPSDWPYVYEANE